MLLRIFLIATSYAWFCHGAASMAKPSTNGQISDIFSRIQIYDGKILQFEVNWNDTLPPDTTYNVIVNPMNLTECPDLPCSVYGISKPSNDLLIPDQPMSYVESMECNYMLGCNYTLTVENSNAAVSKTQPIAIPYCVEQLCSCQHWKMLPPVNAVVNVTNNQTIEISWNIDLHALQASSQLPAAIQELTLSSIYLKLSKQTNPSLSWGGKHIPIAEHLYPIENGSHALALAAANLLKGSFEVEVSEALPPKTVLFLRTYVIDSLGCDGPEEIVKTEVPAQSVPFVELMSTDFDLRVGLIVITTLFVLLMGTALAFFIWRRQKAKCDSQIDQDEQYFAPLAAVIDRMEDNINYVDKDIEDAQVKGLADIFEVPHHAIRMGPEIGEGAFGRVYQATATNIRRMRGTTVVAVKQLKKNPTEDEVDEFLSEIEMLKGVGTHYNIVSFLGCCTIRPPYLMIMEFVGRGDLLSYLRIVRQEASKFKSRDANYVSQNGKRQQQEQQQLKPPVVPVSYIELKVSEESIYDEAEEERRPKPSVAETTYTIIDSNDRSEIVEPFQYILNHKELHNFAMQIANGMRFLEEQEVTHR